MIGQQTRLCKFPLGEGHFCQHPIAAPGKTTCGRHRSVPPLDTFVTPLHLTARQVSEIMVKDDQPWKMAPSDFAFLYEECKRCYYLKVVRKQRRPSAPFPAIFSKIDVAMKQHYLDRHSGEVGIPGLPPGIIRSGRNVQSAPLNIPGAANEVSLGGNTDIMVECDDGTLAIIDFKTSSPKSTSIYKYSRQLHSYAMAVENPLKGEPQEVSHLGLVCFTPGAFGADGLHGELQHVTIPLRRDDFDAFLQDVVSTLSQPSPPPASPRCQFCAYRRG